MKVETEIHETWSSLKEHGDLSKLEDKYGINRNVFAAALATGECASQVFIALNEFYAAKKQRIEDSKQKIAS